MLLTSKVLIIFTFIKFITWAFKVTKTLLIKDQVPGSGILLSRCTRPPHCTVTSVHSLLIYSVNQLAQPSQQRQTLVTAIVYITSPCITRAAAALPFPSCSPHTARAIRIRTSPKTPPPYSKSREEPSKSYIAGPSYFFPSACSAQETQNFLQGTTDQVPTHTQGLRNS